MVNRTSLYQYTSKEARGHSISTASARYSTRWSMIICATILGILALFLFLSLGGMYAIIGPWLVFAGTVVMTKRSSRKQRS
ncbi:MAG: hypothetical protein ACJ788_24370 [Ktedonobacteraceae bacterium]